MKIRIGCVVLGFLLLVISMAAQTSGSAGSTAQLPRLMKFSGTLKDANGNALTGVVGVTFALYSEPSGGAPLWLETQNVQADKNGHYTILLGSTKPEGLPMDLFVSEQAQWLGVRPERQVEPGRVLLVAVPYALKAADAETVGGLPPSAFVLAAPAGGAASATAMAGTSSAPPPATITGSGTAGFLPDFTGAASIGNSAVFQTGASPAAKIGINNKTPAVALDITGAETVRGALTLPATGAATATAGKNSQPQDLVASSFSSSTRKAVNQTFQWQAEPAANNTVNPSGTLNLLYGLGATTPAETGLKISNKGIFTFAPGQTFAGTVTSVGLSAPSSDFTVTGSPITKSGTLALNWKVAPTSADMANAIVKRDSTGSFNAGAIIGTLGVEGETALNCGGCAGVSGVNTGGGIGVYGINAGDAPAILGQNSATSGGIADGVHGVTTSASASGVAGVNNSGGIGVYGTGGTGVFGTGSAYGFQTDSNVQQARSAGGWVKAMFFANALTPPYSIVYCFNSTLTGAAATTPPCGINFTEAAFGIWHFDVGFKVDDRFVSTTLSSSSISNSGAAACIAADTFFTVVEVVTWDCGGSFKAASFYVLVF